MQPVAVGMALGEVGLDFVVGMSRPCSRSTSSILPGCSRHLVTICARRGYLVTKDDRIVMASEMGVLKIPEEQIVTKWRLQPGKMLLVDLEQGRLIPDDEIKADLAKSHPYSDWLHRTQLQLEELPDAPAKGVRSNLPLLDRQQAFGYSQEDITILMTPMASTGEEAAGSMGNDTPISALSDKPKQLFTYFKQNFRAGHQPADRPDPRGARDEPRSRSSGRGRNLFDLQGLASTQRLEVRQPILTDADLEKIARSLTSPTPTSSRAPSTPPSTPASARPAWSRCSTSSAHAPKARCARASTSSSCPIA